MNELITVSENGELTTTSVKLAERFGRTPSSVNRTIRNILKDLSEDELRLCNIAQSYYLQNIPNKAKKKINFFEFNEEMAIVITGRLTGSKAVVAQMKLAAEFIAMRDYIRAQESAQVQLTHDDRRMLAITKINPNTLKAITGERNNRKVKVSYDALVEYGLFGVSSSFVEKRTYFVKPLGYEFISGFTHNTPNFTPEKHEELTRIIEQFMITQSRGQTDVFIQ